MARTRRKTAPAAQAPARRDPAPEAASDAMMGQPMPHDDRRRHRRRVVVWKARLAAGSHQFVCWIRNVSPTGMMIQVDLPLAVHSAVRIETDKYGAFDGFIAWTSEALHGIAFVEPPERIRARFGRDSAKLGLDLPQGQ